MKLAVRAFVAMLAASLFFTLSINSALPMTITINLGPQGVVEGQRAIDLAQHGIPFSDLNGTLLQGQTLSVDFVFSAGEFVRLFTDTNVFFLVGPVLQTDATLSLPPNPASAFVTDIHGNAISPVNHFGSGGETSNNPNELLRFGGGSVFPLLEPEDGLRTDIGRPFDFYGLHVDLTAPLKAGAQITGGQFFITGEKWGIGPHTAFDSVPDHSSALWLALFSVWIVVVLHRLCGAKTQQGETDLSVCFATGSRS